MKHLMKLGMIPLVMIVLFACGGGEEEMVAEVINFKNTKEKVSFAIGVESAVGLFKEDPKFEDLDKAMLIEGFNSNVSNAPVTDCEETLRKFLGEQGMDFDTTYLKEGSRCIGRMSGFYFHMQMEQMGMMGEIDIEMVKKGFFQGVYEQDTVNMSTDERTKVLKEFGEKIQNKFLTEIAEKDQVFWRDVLSRPGVTQIGQTGIYMETIKAGTGGQPDATSDVEAHYILTNALGDTLQSSYVSGQAIQTNLNGVVQGWREAFPALKKGGKYRLFIPYEKAYKGGDPQAPQGALCFFIEFLNFGPAGSIVKPQAQAGGY
jgi:FKBP-type peptidyl-prolyl cis-trans isomerase FkpA